MDDADRRAKLEFINAYFDDKRERVEFLAELWRGGRQDEALTLCCCYIDAFANQYYHEIEGSAKCFVTMLIEHGGEDVFSLHSAVSFVRWLENATRKEFVAAAKTLRARPAEELRRLLPQKDFEAYVGQLYAQNDFRRLQKELWRGSVAFVIYEHLRNPFVHRLAGSGAVSLGPDDDSKREIGFPTLYKALTRIQSMVHEVSTREVKFFGRY